MEVEAGEDSQDAVVRERLSGFGGSFYVLFYRYPARNALTFAIPVTGQAGVCRDLHVAGHRGWAFCELWPVAGWGRFHLARRIAWERGNGGQNSSCI